MQEESEFCKKCGGCEYRLYPLTTNDCPMVGYEEGWKTISLKLPLPFHCSKHKELSSVTMEEVRRLNPPPRGTYLSTCMPYYRVALFKKLKGE
jgi:hypothetical protein